MTSHSTTDTGRDDPFMGSQPGEWTTLVAQMVKNPPAMLVRPLGWEDPLEEGMATHSSILHGQRSLVGCRLWGHKELDMTE